MCLIRCHIFCELTLSFVERTELRLTSRFARSPPATIFPSEEGRPLVGEASHSRGGAIVGFCARARSIRRLRLFCLQFIIWPLGARPRLAGSRILHAGIRSPIFGRYRRHFSAGVSWSVPASRCDPVCGPCDTNRLGRTTRVRGVKIRRDIRMGCPPLPRIQSTLVSAGAPPPTATHLPMVTMTRGSQPGVAADIFWGARVWRAAGS